MKLGNCEEKLSTERFLQKFQNFLTATDFIAYNMTIVKYKCAFNNVLYKITHLNYFVLNYIMSF